MSLLKVKFVAHGAEKNENVVCVMAIVLSLLFVALSVCQQDYSKSCR